MSKQKFWNWNDRSELVLDGVIASESWYGDEVTPQLFRDELATHNGDLTIVINSPGGDVFAGVAIYNALKNRNDGHVTVRVDGVAASIASVIAMAGDTIKMSLGSTMMIHKPWSMAMGDAEELTKTIELLNKLEGSIIDIYAERTGLDKEKIAELLAAETWLNPEEAVALGFADEAPEQKTSLSDAIKNVKDLLSPVHNAVMQPMMSIQAKANTPAKNEVEEADATDTTPPVDEAVEQTVETEPPVEAEPAKEVEEAKDETEAQEVTEPVAEQTKEPVKEKEINAMTKIAETQVLEPKAQASVDATPKVDAKAWFKTKDAVEAFTMALADNAGKSFQDEEVQAAYKAAQVKAGITDPSVFTLPEPVITSIEDAVKSGEIYSRMNHTGLDVFKLVWDDADSELDTSRAGGFNGLWEDSSSNIDRTKEEQILDFEKRVIRAQYIYKYLVLGKETIRENRSTGALVRFVLNELPVRIIRELERAAIIGDGRLAGSKRKITSFVSVKADATAGNAFASTYTRQAGESLAEAVRRAASLIEADGEVVLIAKKGFSVDAMFEKDASGDLLFPIGASAETVLGVNTIIEPSWLTDTSDPDNDAYLVVLSQYHTVGDNSVEAFTNFKLETNENEFLQEIYKGGALAAVKSAVAISASVASS